MPTPTQPRNRPGPPPPNGRSWRPRGGSPAGNSATATSGPIDAPTAPYVYCPHRHKVEATVPAAATAAQVCAALRVRLTEHLIDNDEAHPTGR